MITFSHVGRLLLNFKKISLPPPSSKPVLSKRGWGEREGEREREEVKEIFQFKLH